MSIFSSKDQKPISLDI